MTLTPEDVDQAQQALAVIGLELPGNVYNDASQLIAPVLDEARQQIVLMQGALTIALAHVAPTVENKAWVIDQMVRILADDGYDALISEWIAAGTDRVWDEGEAP